MSWLFSIVFAGLMFSSDGGNLPVHKNYSYAESGTERKVKADETERFEQTYPLSADGKVSVSNVNGSITVETWDKAEVKLDYVKTADSRERLGEVEIKIDARQDSFTVETNFDKWKRGDGNWSKNSKFEIEYHLTVPRNAVLDEIETINGSVSIANAGNSTKASVVNGQLRATNLRGAAHLSSVNGTVEADFDQLQAGSRISLDTVNGQVNLTVPSDANATVRADTLNGQIVNDFNLPVRKGEYVGRDLYGRIGNGDVKIKLSSVNGGLSLKRKSDGKTPNAATNLLSGKSFDEDEDWDNDDDDKNDSRVRPPRPPRAPKSQRTTAPLVPAVPPAPPAPNNPVDNESVRKLIEESLKDAQKEISKLDPEVQKKYADAIKQASKLSSEEIKAQENYKAAQENYKAALANMSDAYWMNGSPSIEEKSESFAVKDKSKVTVEAGNCAVFVRGWDKPEVRYAVTRISKIRGEQPLELKATQNGSDISVKVIGNYKTPLDEAYNELNRSRIEVFVPKKTDLKIITSGEIRLEGISGAIDLQGADEAVNVRDADGKLSVGTNGGRIRVIGFRGDFDGRTSDGVMTIEGDFQSFNALAADGTIVLTLPENANAVFESDAEIETEGVKLIRENAKEKHWHIGSGGATYRMSVGEGRVVVRSAEALKTDWQ